MDEKLREQIARVIFSYVVDHIKRREAIIQGISRLDKDVDQIITLIKEVGYKSPEEVELLTRDLEALKHSRPVYKMTNLEIAEQTKQELYDAGYLPVEPVKLEVLGDKETETVAKENTPFYSWGSADWGNIVHAIKLGSQATVAHNEAKGQLYRRI